MVRLSPLDFLVGVLYWELALLGAVLLWDPANDLYGTFGLIAPVRSVGALYFASALALLAAYLRQSHLQRRPPHGVTAGRLAPTTRALYWAGALAGCCLIGAGVAYLVEFDSLTTAQAMYFPSGLGCFYVASEGRSPWA